MSILFAKSEFHIVDLFTGLEEVTHNLLFRCHKSVIMISNIRAESTPGIVLYNMFATKQLGKSQANRLVEIEEQLLYMSEVPNGIGLLVSCMNEIVVKTNKIDKMAGHLKAMPVVELMIGVKALEDKDTTTGGFECRNSSMAFIAQTEELIDSLDNAQQVMVQMIS